MTNILENKIILDIKIADDQKALKFITNDGEIIAKTDGDCCSNSWIENIDLPINGFPARVISVDNLDLDKESEGEHGSEVTQFYGLKITTDKGDILLDYRNESNGYYGGNLHWPDESYFYGGVYGQNISTENWININSK